MTTRGLLVAVMMVLGLVITACGGTTTSSGSTSASSACQSTANKYPSIKSRTITVGIVPGSPPYETVDASNPDNLIGFDPDLARALTSCLGVPLKFQSMTFDGLIPALQAKRIDMVMSGMYATSTRAQIINFVAYLQSAEGSLVKKGNPKNLNSLDDLCGNSAAEVLGQAEMQIIMTQSAKCLAAGKKAIRLDGYKDIDATIAAVRNDRSDITLSDAGFMAATAKQFPDTQTAFSFTSGFVFGIGINKDDNDLLHAINDALTDLQADGTVANLMTKWGFTSAQLQPAKIITS